MFTNNYKIETGDPD